MDEPLSRWKSTLPAALVLLLAAADARGARIPPRAADLSLEQKVGQLFAVALDTEIAAQYEPYIRDGRLGSAMLRWDMFTGDEARAMATRLQGWAAAAPVKIPFLVSADHEGGALFTQRLYGATVFPGNMALGAAGSPALAEAAAFTTGRELRALGIRMNFAPVVDVNTNPGNPVIGIRSFGEDPALAASLGAAAVKGYTRAGVASAPKHFPGHGDTLVDSHLGLPVSTRTLQQLEEGELVPFVAAIQAGAPVIMPAHIVIPALGDGARPVTLSSAAIEGYLRGRLGFKGVVVSDSLDMGAIANTYGAAESAVLALEAGCDLLLMGKGDFPGAFTAVLEAARSGRISLQRLDTAVGRVLALKKGLGLFAAARPDLPLSVTRRPEHRTLARDIARRAVTLLRADPAVLPLGARSGRLLVVLPHSSRFADEARGFFSDIAKRHPASELLSLPAVPRQEHIAEAERRAAASDTVVLTLYHWGPLGAEQAALGAALQRTGKPIVHLELMNPYGLSSFPDSKNAMCTYGMTPAALQAAASLLFGEARPSGRLPVTIPGFAARGAGLKAFPRAE